MKPQPDTNGHRPIPPIHPDTIAFEKHLSTFEFGQKLTYEAAAVLVRRSLETNEAAIKAHLRSAENRLRNLAGMVFGSYYDEQTGERGRVRLDDVGIVNRATHLNGSIGRRAKRIERIAACANPDKLPDDKRLEQAVALVASRGVQKFSSSKGREVLTRLVRNSKDRIPELEETLRALLN